MVSTRWIILLIGVTGPLWGLMAGACAQEPHSASEPAVWFHGTIGTWEQTSYPSTQVMEQEGNYATGQVAPPGVTAIPTYSSFDTTAMVGYDEKTSILDDVGDQIYERSQRIGLTQTVPEGGCEELTTGIPQPWLTWKSTSMSATWIPGSGDDFGMTDINLRGTIKSPRLPFLSITPNYQMTFLDGPDSTDIPGTLHRAAVSFMGMMPLSERWIGQVMVSPGIASDYKNTSSESLRIVGMGSVIFLQSPQLQWVFGVIYLDRDDVPLLPAVGLTWSPDERTKYEFSFPRPRYLRQLWKDGEREQWWYLAAELGGGSWAIERSSGVDDVVTLRDYRLLTGMEYKYPNDHSWYWEAGLVIGREVEYDSGIGDYRQDPSIVLRCGITY